MGAGTAGGLLPTSAARAPPLVSVSDSEDPGAGWSLESRALSWPLFTAPRKGFLSGPPPPIGEEPLSPGGP